MLGERIIPLNVRSRSVWVSTIYDRFAKGPFYVSLVAANTRFQIRTGGYRSSEEGPCGKSKPFGL